MYTLRHLQVFHKIIPYQQAFANYTQTSALEFLFIPIIWFLFLV